MAFHSLLLLAVLPTLTLAIPRPDANVVVPVSTCNVTTTNPPPKGYSCARPGKLANPLLLSSGTAVNLDACVTSCKVDNKNKCISFGYDATTKDCQLYKKGLNKQGYKDKKTDTGYLFYNRRCFTVNCESPPDPTPDPDPDPCTVPPTGDSVINGGFECGLSSWDTSYSSGSSGGVTALGEGGSVSSFYVHSPAARYDPSYAAGILKQSIDIPDIRGTNHEISMYVRFSGGGQGVAVALAGHVFGNIDSGTLGAFNEFHRVSFLTNIAGPDSLLEIHLGGLTEAAPDAYIDNIAVVATTETIDPCTLFEPPPRDLISNGGFECGLTAWDVSTNSPATVTGQTSSPGQAGSLSFNAHGTDSDFNPAVSQLVLSQYLMQDLILSNFPYQVFFAVKFTAADQEVSLGFNGVKYQTVRASDHLPIENWLNLSYALPDSATQGFDTPIEFSFYGIKAGQSDIYLDGVSIQPNF